MMSSEVMFLLARTRYLTTSALLFTIMDSFNVLQGHMDYLESSYADLATMCRIRPNKIGVQDIQEAWNVKNQEEVQKEMMQRN